ncbi:MAG: DUF692 domain-containing protein [Rhodobacter sp.]|nr:DUF692 domain-containing protein [Paracoccaceae bacterium]MCC0071693.1 DUF692 domain-containing protein [Rhodobacter sp.]
MPLPPHPGVGFKPDHYAQILRAPGAVRFIEVHAENYMGAGGAPHAMLDRLHADHALSVHGVGLSIGGAGPLDRDHLARLKTLLARHRPESFSEHLAWSSHGAAWLNDLLPLPYTDQTLETICTHVDQVQTALGTRMLLENPATYLTFPESTWSETDFLRQIARRTGCGLLLDVNNVFVSATNHGFDARAYLSAFPLDQVAEIHLAGHEVEALPEGPLLIDSHSRPVADPVWSLYAWALSRTGPLPTLIEWDNDLPDWPVLRAEAGRAETILHGVSHDRAL